MVMVMIRLVDGGRDGDQVERLLKVSSSLVAEPETGSWFVVVVVVARPSCRELQAWTLALSTPRQVRSGLIRSGLVSCGK